MIEIHSASALARFAETCTDDTLRPLLIAKADLLAEYDDLATFIILEPTDTPEAWPEPEFVETFGAWSVITIITGDSGEGVILFVPTGAL